MVWTLLRRNVWIELQDQGNSIKLEWKQSSFCGCLTLLNARLFTFINPKEAAEAGLKQCVAALLHSLVSA